MYGRLSLVDLDRQSLAKSFSTASSFWLSMMSPLTLSLPAKNACGRNGAWTSGGARRRQTCERRGTFWGSSFPRNTSMKSSSDTEKVTSALEARLSRDPRPVFRSTAAGDGDKHHQQSLVFSRITFFNQDTFTGRVKSKQAEISANGARKILLFSLWIKMIFITTKVLKYDFGKV